MHFILISLPLQYNPFKINYNAQREKWSLTELISHCVQEEERLKQEKTESAHLAFQGNTTNKKRKKSESKGRNTNTTTAANPIVAKVQEKKPKVIACFFCKKVDHIKQDCIKYQK